MKNNRETARPPLIPLSSLDARPMLRRLPHLAPHLFHQTGRRFKPRRILQVLRPKPKPHPPPEREPDAAPAADAEAEGAEGGAAKAPAHAKAAADAEAWRKEGWGGWEGSRGGLRRVPPPRPVRRGRRD